MNEQMHLRGRRLRVLSVAATAVLATACHDVEYDYNIPENDADCPDGMTYRSSGSGIVDRSSGAGIVDRNDDSVTSYCYVDNCSGSYDDSVAATIEWHKDDHEVVVANRRCLAETEPPN